MESPGLGLFRVVLPLRHSMQLLGARRSGLLKGAAFSLVTVGDASISRDAAWERPLMSFVLGSLLPPEQKAVHCFDLRATRNIR